jgi:ATP-binding cassette, subfamily A (ABC1), member 3
MLKGVSSDKINEEVERTIREVDLNSKRRAFAKNLSGGQKRKLSVGIAMIGDSKLVLLDEPTSGMDLTARRKIWDMLKNNKQGKILILTTHFMDEADILGDRIAIMAGGNIKCCGGSLFLKKRYGVGYNLIIAKENKDPNPEIDTFVHERIQSAIKLSEVSSEVTYQIPQNESNKFETFFTDLDQSLKILKIKSYGVGVTTLEEVFLRVGKDEDEEELHDPRKSISDMKREVEEMKKEKSQGTIKSLNDSGENEIVDEYTIAEESVQNVFWLHFWAL